MVYAVGSREGIALSAEAFSSDWVVLMAFYVTSLVSSWLTYISWITQSRAKKRCKFNHKQEQKNIKSPTWFSSEHLLKQEIGYGSYHSNGNDR